METLTSCPVCKAGEYKPYLACVDHTVSRETFEVVQCASCGFRFTSPRPAENEIGKYYQAEEYISHSDTNKGIVNKLYKLVRDYTIGKKVKLINKLQTPSSGLHTLLDIGCGTGEFLNACKADGWSVTGIEPSEVARKNTEQKFGITPLPQEKLFELNEKKFQVITMWHVLEHVHQLDRTIEQINKILLDDGTLVIAVPNCDSWDAKKYGAQWAAWDVPRHLYHFTKKDIEALFKRSGFKLAEVLPMKFDSFYVSLLSEKYKTGRSDLVAGFLNGWSSNHAANKNGYSSQIYILKKHVNT